MDAPTPQIQMQDMGRIQRSPWPHWRLFSPNTHEFVDPAGDRTIRVVCFERLQPGGEGTMMSASYVPSHSNSYDVLSANLRLPLPGSGREPVEPLDGMLMLRPECLFWEGTGPMPAQPPATDHVQVNIYVHTDGPSGEPMITLPELAEMVTGLQRQQPGRAHADRGEYVAEDGSVHELLEVCWEARMGRKFRYPDPPRLSVPLVLPVSAYAWHRSRTKPGVYDKPFVSLSGGPAMRLVKLDKGALLQASRLDKHRLVAILAGTLVDGAGKHLNELTVLYIPPAGELGKLVAETATLLWVVDWQRKGDAAANFWES